MMKKLILALAFAAATSTAQAAIVVEENFDKVEALAGQGWLFQTRSIPSTASSGWTQGLAAIFEAHTPPSDAYIASSFELVPEGSFVDDRLFTPAFSVAHGASATFYLRGEQFEDFFDLLSFGFTNGSGTEPEDFILGQTIVVPTDDWTEFTITLGAQGPGATARLGFRHFGPYDTANIVALDTLRIEIPDAGAIPEPASLLIMGLGLAGLPLARRRH